MQGGVVGAVRFCHRLVWGGEYAPMIVEIGLFGMRGQREYFGGMGSGGLCFDPGYGLCHKQGDDQCPEVAPAQGMLVNMMPAVAKFEFMAGVIVTRNGRSSLSGQPAD